MRKHPLLINLKFSKISGMIVYHSRTVCKNFKIFNKTGKDFVLIHCYINLHNFSLRVLSNIQEKFGVIEIMKTSPVFEINGI
jgi:hypothetical protein